MLKPLGAEPMTAAQAVTWALEAAADSAPNFNIAQFWMSLYECGYEVVPRPTRIDGSRRAEGVADDA